MSTRQPTCGNCQPRAARGILRQLVVTTASVLAALVLIEGGFLGRELTPSTARADAPDASVVRVAVAVAANEISAADAIAPAVRSRVQPVPPTSRMPAELAASISEMVSTVNGCTHTAIGSSVVSAAHCGQSGFSNDGDIAWTGPQPEWADPSLIPIGATIYGVGYPQAAPGPQHFTLANLGSRTITLQQRPQLVLMAVGDGLPCTSGASGMVAWVTIDDAMVPIGPMSVFSIEPAITGLPAGQYVCGFAISADE